MRKRKTKSVNMTLIVKDSTYDKCRLDASVRNLQVAIFTSGGDEWAHLTLKQAKLLRSFMDTAIREITERKRRQT